MGLTDRSSEAIGGPRGGTAWFDCGDSFTLAQAGTNGHTSFTVTTTAPGLIPAQTVTRPNPFIAGSISAAITYQDSLDSTNVLQSLYGFQVAASVLMATQIHLNLQMSVYRTIGRLKATGLNGTSITLKEALTQAIPNSASLTATKADGTASTTVTLTAAAQAGDTTLTVTSVDLTAYLVNSMFTWQVGGAYAFGWAAGAGAGTPAFPLGASVVAPINTANTSVVTTGANAWLGTGGTTAAQAGFIPVQAGDVITILATTDSSTVTCQVLNIQPLMT